MGLLKNVDDSHKQQVKGHNVAQKPGLKKYGQAGDDRQDRLESDMRVPMHNIRVTDFRAEMARLVCAGETVFFGG
jgi:hypothetical protein